MRVAAHCAELTEHLQFIAERVRASLDEPGTDEERALRFEELLRQELRRHMTDRRVPIVTTVDRVHDEYIVAAAFRHLWFGLARYWRKKSA